MSGYIIEEPNETPIFYNNDNTVKINNDYWLDYSNIQRKRFSKVLRQLNETWYSIFNQITFVRNNSSITLEESNAIMSKIHRLFIIEHKNKIEYYKEEQIRLRKQKGYIIKKITKLKNSKQKI